MILQSLYELFDRLVGDETYELSPPGFSPQKISFYLVLHPDGTMVVNDARVPGEKGKPVPRRLEVPGEAKPSGAGINPGFLWDNQTYLLGQPPKGQTANFGQRRFEAFRQRHLEIEKEINTLEFSAVCRFLESWSPERLVDYPLLNEVGTGFGVFKILGEPHPVHVIPAIRDWWMNHLPVEADSVQGQCLLTGEILPIARLHPKIKGVLGAQSSGAPLVSFNERSYESYGKDYSYNSPVGRIPAFRYGTALNALLDGPQRQKHRIRIGDSTCVFWTGEKTDFEDAFPWLANAGSRAPEAVQDATLSKKLSIFLNAIKVGKEAFGTLADDLKTEFFILGLAPNAARLSVRFFYHSTIRELLEHLHEHKRNFEIVREFEHPVGKRFADSEFPAYWEFLRETVRQGDDPSPLLGGALLRAILEGTPYPEMLLGAIVRRTQIERAVNYLRAAAIKAVLSRNHHLALTYMLDLKNEQPAYLRGRLFAVLQKIQEEGFYEQTGRALERSGIRDIYFAAASATPGSIFPRVQTLSTHHRRHLNPGRKIHFDKLVADIEWPLPPASAGVKSHTLEEQGLFILGYYHQRKALFPSKAETPNKTDTPAPAESAA